jgi:RNA polymerase sigma factor (TIGR02999 family)
LEGGTPVPLDDPETQMTQLITEWTESRSLAAPELFELIYKDLHKVAQGYMRRERADHTLQATALINEAYLRIFHGKPFHWNSRKHLFCAMAQTMRRILVDHARNHCANKRGGEQRKMELDEGFAISEQKSPQVLALDEALEKLEKLDTRRGQVVELRYFAGLTVEETAAVLDVSPETVKLDWRFAKSWLQREISRNA